MGINLLADYKKPINLLPDYKKESNVLAAKSENTEQQNTDDEQFLPPKKEGIGSWLPRDIMIGLLKQRQNLVNTPHDIVQNLEGQGKEFGNSINKAIPLDKYIGSNRLPFGSNANPKNISDYLPHETNDFSKLMGQEGIPSTGSWLIQKAIEHAPEIAGLGSIAKNIPITSKGLIKKLSKDKTKELSIAKKEYGNLFEEASQNGLTHAIPEEPMIKKIMDNSKDIVKNSIPKYHASLRDYLKDPTIEKAHWAQSELGALERHLDKISQKTGLTPSQIKTYKSVKDTRGAIKKAMFSDNSLGNNAKLASDYESLSNKYKKNVIPYTRLEELSETESMRMLPKNAIKRLLNDDQFIIELSKKYPGLQLHTPGTKKIINTLLGTGVTLLGYEGIKKLLK